MEWFHVVELCGVCLLVGCGAGIYIGKRISVKITDNAKQPTKEG